MAQAEGEGSHSVTASVIWNSLHMEMDSSRSGSGQGQVVMPRASVEASPPSLCRLPPLEGALREPLGRGMAVFTLASSTPAGLW